MATLASTLPSRAVAARAGPRAHSLRRLLRRPAAGIGLTVIVIVVAVALLAPVVAPYDPLATSWTAIRKAPSSAHWFGTDEIGRDVLSRVILRARASLLAGNVYHQTSALIRHPRRVLVRF